MKRTIATRALEDALARVVKGGRYEDLVKTIHVFGSYARGALEPDDIDILVSRASAWWFSSQFATDMARGRDAYLDIKHAVVGRSRRFHVLFDAPGNGELAEAVLIYQRGDTLEQARGRLRAIPVNEVAGRAPRAPFHPALRDIAKNRPAAASLTALADLGWLEIERVVVDDGTGPLPREPYRWALERTIEHLWGHGPTGLAVRKAVVFMDARGFAPGELIVSNENLGEMMRYYVRQAAGRAKGFAPRATRPRASICWRRLEYQHDFSNKGEQLDAVLMLLNPQRGREPTPQRPLLGLVLRACDRTAFDELIDETREPTPRVVQYHALVHELAGIGAADAVSGRSGEQ